MTRELRQLKAHEFCIAAFGIGQASSVPQRALRLLEEAIELYQAAGCTEEMAHKLVSFVFSRPVGEIGRELGGVGLTVLAFAAASGLSADAEEARELARVEAKGPRHFTARNQAKSDAGFLVKP